MTAPEGQNWSTLHQAALDAPEPARTSPARRWITGLTIVAVAVIVVIGGAFLAETVARGFTEDAVAAAVEANLPANVEGTVDADIGGDWVILQLLSGRMQEVTVSSDDVTFDGVPIGFLSVTASGVPVDLKGAADSVEATATLDEAALNELLTMPGNDPQLILGDGAVTYEDSTTVLGFTVGYLVSATLEPDPAGVLLTPESAELTSDIGSLDVSRILEGLLGGEPVLLCTADRLPEGVSVSRILVTEGSATLGLSATDFTLTMSALRSKGECPS